MGGLQAKPPHLSIVGKTAQLPGRHRFRQWAHLLPTSGWTWEEDYHYLRTRISTHFFSLAFLLRLAAAKNLVQRHDTAPCWDVCLYTATTALVEHLADLRGGLDTARQAEHAPPPQALCAHVYSNAT